MTEFIYRPHDGQPDSVPLPERKRQPMPQEPDPSKAPNPSDFPDEPHIVPVEKPIPETIPEKEKEDA